MLDHRHSRIGRDISDQCLTASWHDQIDIGILFDELRYTFTAVVRQQGDRCFGKSVYYQYCLKQISNGTVGVLRLFAPFKDGDIAAFETECAYISCDIGTRLIDHTDHTDRYCHLLDLEAGIGIPAVKYPSDRLFE